MSMGLGQDRGHLKATLADERRHLIGEPGGRAAGRLIEVEHGVDDRAATAVGLPNHLGSIVLDSSWKNERTSGFMLRLRLFDRAMWRIHRRRVE